MQEPEANSKAVHLPYIVKPAGNVIPSTAKLFSAINEDVALLLGN